MLSHARLPYCTEPPGGPSGGGGVSPSLDPAPPLCPVPSLPGLPVRFDAAVLLAVLLSASLPPALQLGSEEPCGVAGSTPGLALPGGVAPAKPGGSGGSAEPLRL